MIEHRTRIVSKLPLVWIAMIVSATLLVDPSAAWSQQIDFNRDIRSLLSNNCVMCHGPDDQARATDLRFDTQAGSRVDLGGYAAIVPGDPDSSDLIDRLTTDDEDLRMPPPGKGRRLTPDEVDRMRRWIEQGGNYAQHWAYQPPQRPELPPVNHSDWPRTAIDHFTLARMESDGLSPSPEADRYALARRVAIDLTGLPPTWSQVQDFVDDPRPEAYDIYVDHLLEQPSFGERWARVWLDLARYADSAGYADDPPRTIWAYRDYVIASLNANKPFDQFTIEQIAGDLLEDPTREQLIATAFHRNTLTNSEGGTNDEEFRNAAVVDRVNTTMAVWMGTTMACAQCHTHKYDPITHEEYFRFFAIFNNTADTDQRDERPTLEIWSDDQEVQKQTWTQQLAEAKDQLQQPTAELQAQQSQWLTQIKDPPQWDPLTPVATKAKHRQLTATDQGWIDAEGERPEHDHYTLRYETTDSSIAGLQLEISPRQASNFVLTKATATWTPKDQERADSRNARFVRIELPGKDKMIHLAEVQVFNDGKNVALQGKASQSSTGYNAPAARAIDGNTEGDFYKDSVTHTQAQADPWLEIDLQQMQSIGEIVLWNRTDGGDSIAARLSGYKVILLDEQRQTVWEQTPKEFPKPKHRLSIDGVVRLRFRDAIADFSQAGFPATSVLADKPDLKSGWAIGGGLGQTHQLTLLFDQPRALGEGVLEIQLQQNSVHKNHLIDHFRVLASDSPNLTQWAGLPNAIRELVLQREPLNDAQAKQLADYYRTIAPLLEPVRKQIARLEKQLANAKPETTVPIQRELPPEAHRKSYIHLRGDYLSKGASVEQGTPAAFHPLSADRPADRLALARWLVDDANALTPRVIANRHWEEIFGIGIVESSEEFGSQGELPSHPELLDWLAVELRESGWDLKALLRLMVTSATYRQSSATTPKLLDQDPANRLLARGPRYRVSAEMVRDQALMLGGLLSHKMFGPPAKPPQPNLGLNAAFGSATDWKTSLGDDKYRRGIYTMWRRSSPYPSMATFDAPNREVCTLRRGRTNTPLQALVTLNDPVYVEAAQGLARRMVSAASTPGEQIAFGLQTCLLRKPTDREVDRLLELYEQTLAAFTSDLTAAQQMAEEPLGKLPAGMDLAQTAALTVVGNVILNLDEVFLKR